MVGRYSRAEEILQWLFQLFEWADMLKASLYLFLIMSACSVKSRRHITSDAGLLSDTPWLNRTCLSAALGLAPADVPLLTVAKSVTTFCFVRLWKVRHLYISNMAFHVGVFEDQIMAIIKIISTNIHKIS